MKKKTSGHCEFCPEFTKDQIVLCGDCDREFIMVDVRFYRQLRAGTFKLKKKIKRLEQPKEG